MTIYFDKGDIYLFIELKHKLNQKIEQSELANLLVNFETKEEIFEFVFHCKKNKIKLSKWFYNFLSIFCDTNEEIEWIKKQAIDRQYKRKNLFQTIYIQQLFLAKTKDEAQIIISEARKNGSNFEGRRLELFNDMEQVLKDRKQLIKEYRDESGRKKQIALKETYDQMKNEYLSNTSLKELTVKVKKEVNVYSRNPLLKEIIKRKADGRCQLCEMQAPFNDKYGNPFFEVHHIDFLSEGGADELDNMVALCPNCHRKVHCLPNEEEKLKLKEKAQLNLN